MTIEYIEITLLTGKIHKYDLKHVKMREDNFQVTFTYREDKKPIEDSIPLSAIAMIKRIGTR